MFDRFARFNRMSSTVDYEMLKSIVKIPLF